MTLEKHRTLKVQIATPALKLKNKVDIRPSAHGALIPVDALCLCDVIGWSAER